MSRRASPALDRGGFAWTSVTAVAALLPIARFLPGWLVAVCAGLFATGIVLGLRGQRLPAALRLALTLTVAGLVLWDYGLVFGASFGRDTGTALLASMVALKVLELERLRDARLLASISLFALMAGFLQDRGPLTLALATVAALIALATLARLAELEAHGPEPVTQPPRAAPRATVAVRRRLGVAGRLALYSLPLALVAFFLFPRLATPLWGLPQNSREARTGLSDSMTPGDISQLFADDSPMLRVTFDGPPPPSGLLYWRGPVLSRFDGRRWTRAGWSAQLPPADLAAAVEPLDYTLQQEPTERRFVFALDLPVEAASGTKLALDRSMLADRPLNEVSVHRLASTPSYVFEPDLRRTLRSQLLALPDGFNPRSVALAAQWRAAAGNNDRAVIEQALALFNREFTYTLTPELLGRDSVDDFLFRTRAGYCEHFSSSFAVLMRAAGIPTRVVTGYQGGEPNAIGGYVLVRQSDAHAWNEVWLPGEGWLRVDPTSAVAPERIESGTSALQGDDEDWVSWGKPLLDTADWLRRGWNDFVLGYGAERQRQLLKPLGIDPADWRQLGLLLAIAVGLALALTMLLLLRRPADGDDALGRAWQRFVRRLARAGAAKEPHEGPRSFGERAASLLPAQAEPIIALSRRYAAARYADSTEGPGAAVPGDRPLIDALRRFRVARSRR